MEILRSTLIFVRRKANWFKENDSEIQWFDADNTSTEDIAMYIYNRLSTLSQPSNPD
jgi:hypothetical protein